MSRPPAGDPYAQGWERGLKLALEILMESDDLEDAKIRVGMMLSPRAKQAWKGRDYYQAKRGN